jgi:hypothetical protein
MTAYTYIAYDFAGNQEAEYFLLKRRQTGLLNPKSIPEELKSQLLCVDLLIVAPVVEYTKINYTNYTVRTTVNRTSSTR